MERRIAPLALSLLSALCAAAPASATDSGTGTVTRSSVRVQALYDAGDPRHAQLLARLAANGLQATPQHAPISTTRGGKPGALGLLAVDATRHYTGAAPGASAAPPDVDALTRPGADDDTLAVTGCDAQAVQSWTYRSDGGRWVLVEYATAQRGLTGFPACPEHVAAAAGA